MTKDYQCHCCRHQYCHENDPVFLARAISWNIALSPCDALVVANLCAVSLSSSIHLLRSLFLVRRDAAICVLLAFAMFW